MEAPIPNYHDRLLIDLVCHLFCNKSRMLHISFCLKNLRKIRDQINNTGFSAFIPLLSSETMSR